MTYISLASWPLDDFVLHSYTLFVLQVNRPFILFNLKEKVTLESHLRLLQEKRKMIYSNTSSDKLYTFSDDGSLILVNNNFNLMNFRSPSSFQCSVNFSPTGHRRNNNHLVIIRKPHIFANITLTINVYILFVNHYTAALDNKINKVSILINGFTTG